jgi:6-pyruvoyltetrahydropterin/6-carboxytetrahydropterin synthase
MEKIRVHAQFHTGHRQIGYPGKCRFVHGHTWRATIVVACDEFPRDELDMALDFGDLKKIYRDLDHKMLVVPSDKEFMDAALFDPEGVVVLQGKGPSVEVVAAYGMGKVIEHIEEKFPGRGVDYFIEVEIQETDNNFFSMDRHVVI